MLSRGDRIGGYEVVAPLTSGGMGTVFLARRVGIAGFQRLVALKRVREDLKNNTVAVERLLHEARLCARLDHPNVARVDELFEEDEIVYLAMEYVHGCSLATLERRLRRLDRRAIPALAVHIVAAIAEALHAAHELRDDDGKLGNVVHRDISPQNVLVSQTGHIKLIDFGVARSPWRSDLTQVGRVLGKLRYMAPEQLRGERVDRRADIFALGVVLWELLTNRSLFWVPDNIESTTQVVRPDVEPPSRWVDGLPSALDDIVMASLASNPSDRPETAIVFRRRLLKVVPEAAILDAPLLASLLAATASEDLARERAEMPDEVSSWLQARALSSVDRGPSATRTVYELTRGSESLAAPDALPKASEKPEAVEVVSRSSTPARPTSTVAKPVAAAVPNDGGESRDDAASFQPMALAAPPGAPAGAAASLRELRAPASRSPRSPVAVEAGPPFSTHVTRPRRRWSPWWAVAAAMVGAAIAIVTGLRFEPEPPSQAPRVDAPPIEQPGDETTPATAERAARVRRVVEPPPPEVEASRRVDEVPTPYRAKRDRAVPRNDVRVARRRARRQTGTAMRRASPREPPASERASDRSEDPTPERRAVRRSSGLPLIERVELGRPE